MKAILECCCGSVIHKESIVTLLLRGLIGKGPKPTIEVREYSTLLKDLLFILALLLLLFLNSCGSEEKINQAVRTESPVSVLNEKISNDRQTPSIPSRQVSAINREDQRAQKIRDIILSPCVESRSSQMETSLSGNLFVMHGFVPYVLNITTGLKTPINLSETVVANEYFISPDGKWLAYTTYHDDSGMYLVVESTKRIVNNESLIPIKLEGDIWFELEGWLDNHSLRLNQQMQTDHFFSTRIIDPFTGRSNVYSLENYPNYMSYKPTGVGIYHFESGNLMPDPTQRRIVYPEQVNGLNYISLWNLEKKEQVTRLRYFYPYYRGDPLWSLDGKDFLMLAATPDFANEWFLVDRDGKIQQITYFVDFLQSNDITKASRSNDGRYLAFLMMYKYDSQEIYKYLIFDIAAENFDGFCIDSTSYFKGRVQAPVWSPDSKYLAISNTDENSFGELILVDLEKKRAYVIAGDVHARGWLAQE